MPDIINEHRNSPGWVYHENTTLENEFSQRLQHHLLTCIVTLLQHYSIEITDPKTSKKLELDAVAEQLGQVIFKNPALTEDEALESSALNTYTYYQQTTQTTHPFRDLYDGLLEELTDIEQRFSGTAERKKMGHVHDYKLHVNVSLTTTSENEEKILKTILQFFDQLKATLDPHLRNQDIVRFKWLDISPERPISRHQGSRYENAAQACIYLHKDISIEKVVEIINEITAIAHQDDYAQIQPISPQDEEPTSTKYQGGSWLLDENNDLVTARCDTSDQGKYTPHHQTTPAHKHAQNTSTFVVNTRAAIKKQAESVTAKPAVEEAAVGGGAESASIAVGEPPALAPHLKAAYLSGFLAGKKYHASLTTEHPSTATVNNP